MVHRHPVGHRRPRPASGAKRKRTSVPQFAREVRDEMRQVAWPSRKEMVNYTVSC